MSLSGLEIKTLATGLALAMVGIALFLTFIRLVRGPTLPDRVVALDLMGVLTVGMIAAYEIAMEQPVLLDTATVLALVGFLGTVAFARYLERRGRDA
ncbi:MAG: cation:proton antiporter [Planctomycetaceae bacterium]|nr:cation:proton antiporter [Planctomycetaceae bacterium]